MYEFESTPTGSGLQMMLRSEPLRLLLGLESGRPIEIDVERPEPWPGVEGVEWGVDYTGAVWFVAQEGDKTCITSWEQFIVCQKGDPEISEEFQSWCLAMHSALVMIYCKLGWAGQDDFASGRLVAAMTGAEILAPSRAIDANIREIRKWGRMAGFQHLWVAGTTATRTDDANSPLVTFVYERPNDSLMPSEDLRRRYAKLISYPVLFLSSDDYASLVRSSGESLQLREILNE